MQKYEFTSASTKLDDIREFQLVVPGCRNLGSINRSSICGSEINYERLCSALRLTQIVGLHNLAKLKYSVLLRAGRMVDWDIDHVSIPAKEERALPVDVEEINLLIAFEHVESPLLTGLPCLGWLVVL